MRIRLLETLRDGPLTTDEPTEALGATQQSASKHVGELVCGGLRQQVAELDQLLAGGAS